MATMQDQDNVVPDAEQQTMSVFDDPQRFSVKHPLQRKWAFWYDHQKGTTAADWGMSLKKLVTIESVEDFWSVFNYLVEASQIPLSSNYHLFKDGIEPSWEDPFNTKGGKWSIIVPKSKLGSLDDFWQNLALACIGEQFTYNDDVAGIVVSSRRGQDRVALWMRSGDNQEMCMKMGTEMKAFLQTRDEIGFQMHSDSAVKRSSLSKDTYRV